MPNLSFGSQLSIASHSSFVYLNSLQSLCFLKPSVRVCVGGGGWGLRSFIYGFLPNRSNYMIYKAENTNPSNRLKQDIKQKASIKLHTNITQMVKRQREQFLVVIFTSPRSSLHSAHIVNNKSWMPFKFSYVFPPTECVFIVFYRSYVIHITKLPG